MQGGPWTFDNHLLVLGHMTIGADIESIPLHHVEFWVQAHHLPVGFMTEAVGKHLGNFIGSFVDYDPANNSCVWRAYMRIRVLVDVRQPLKKERKVRVAGAEWTVVKFRYEKLPNLCFICGCIGHTEQACEELFRRGVDDSVRGWSNELQADLRRGVAAQRVGGCGMTSLGSVTLPQVVAAVTELEIRKLLIFRKPLKPLRRTCMGGRD